MKKNIKKTNLKSKLKPIILVVLCTIFTSMGQILFKIASKNFSSTVAVLTNIPLYFGFFFYAIGALFMIISLKYGELSVVYPFISLSFIWVNISSIFLFNESISIINWIGIVGIVLGVSLIGYGSTGGTANA